MSSPIAICRTSTSSSSSSSYTSSSSQDRALYVPIHKCGTPSSTVGISATQDVSSSPYQLQTDLLVETANPHIYSIDYLLSLRPFAAEGIKEKIHATCPEAVINHRVRKRIEISEDMGDTALQSMTMTTRRVTPCRTRFTGGTPERWIEALSLHHDTCRSLWNTDMPLSLVSV